MYIYIKDGVLTNSGDKPRVDYILHNIFGVPRLRIRYGRTRYELIGSNYQRITLNLTPEGTLFRINTRNREMKSYGKELRKSLELFRVNEMSNELMTEIFNQAMERMKKISAYVTEVHDQSIHPMNYINFGPQCKSAN